MLTTLLESPDANAEWRVYSLRAENYRLAGRWTERSADQLRAANTLAVISSTEPTPAMALYFGVPSAAASFW